jgi:diguanylate cyclase (GGDEF)-like protein
MARKRTMRLKLYSLSEALGKRSPVFWLVTGLISAGMLGVLDWLTGNEITVGLFYLIPIVLVTWAVSRRAGLLLSVLSALILLAAERAAGQIYSHPIIYFWNTLIRASFFVIITYLVAELHRAQHEAHLAARTDYVTGVVNARYFTELLQMEVERIRRYPHPITVVFIDVDNFKRVNDLFGHKMGDEVLRVIADELKAQLRSTDCIARLGGDEFALLLPSARQTDAESVVSKVHTHLREEMLRRNLPITFSMGAVTCIVPPYSAEQIINMADELMYEVKNSTKDGVRFTTWGNGAHRNY